MMAGAGIFIISQLIQGIRELDWASVWWRNAPLDCGTPEFSERSFWSRTIMSVGGSFGDVAIGKSFVVRWQWERMWWRLRCQRSEVGDQKSENDVSLCA